MSSKLKGRVFELEATLAMIEELALQIRYRALSVFALADALGANPVLGRLRFIERLQQELECTRDFPQAWRGAVCAAPTSLRERDLDILLTIGAQLGTSDTQGQLANLELQAGLAKARLGEAREELMRKGKMYRSLGLLIGLGISILII